MASVDTVQLFKFAMDRGNDCSVGSTGESEMAVKSAVTAVL